MWVDSVAALLRLTIICREWKTARSHRPLNSVRHWAVDWSDKYPSVVEVLAKVGAKPAYLDGRAIASLPLIERKALLEPLVAAIPSLQFNGNETGDGELNQSGSGRSER